MKNLQRAQYTPDYESSQNLIFIMSKSFLSSRDEKYQGLMEVYKRVNHGRPFLTIQSELNKMWKEELDSGKDEKLFNDMIIN